MKILTDMAIKLKGMETMIDALDEIHAEKIFKEK